jgi:2-keto-myo-inositol isomerase
MINRRELIKTVGATVGLSFLPGLNDAQTAKKTTRSFTYCLNMATIRGHNLGFVRELEVASKAGFKAVEIWIDSLQNYLKSGGTAGDAKKRLDDLGITVENTIGFAPWVLDDDAKRNEGLEQMKREMDLLSQLGCKRTAAPPVGATTGPLLELKRVAERYRAVLELGDRTGVVPQLEMWGFSKNLGRTSEVMYAALESGHPAARVLLDVYHIYKGGSGLDTLHLINPSAVEILHMNDYSANLSAAVITDADRVFPGDGVAPIGTILQTLGKREKPLVISVEVFNKDYYKQDPLVVAKTALAKMKAVTTALPKTA